MIEVVEVSVEPLMLELQPEREILRFIGEIAGECYGSSKDTDKCVKRALDCARKGHHSPWEHYNLTFRCIVDRGTSHALVRHRHCAFQQSSTIYQKYTDGIKIVGLPEFDPCTGKPVEQVALDMQTYETAATRYKFMIDHGIPPSRARDVLPNALATTLIITTNIPQWIYMIRRRQGPGDAVRMHVWADLMEERFVKMLPETWEAFDTWYINGRKL